MVLSGDSFSLELPLDIRAAMEKALAREESCGLGGGVYSMASRRGSGAAWTGAGAGAAAAVVVAVAERGDRAGGRRSAPGAVRSPALTRGRRDPIGRRPIGGGTRQGPRPGPAAEAGGREGGREEEDDGDDDDDDGDGGGGFCPPAGWAGGGRCSRGLPAAAPPPGNTAPAPRRGPGCGLGVRPPLL